MRARIKQGSAVRQEGTVVLEMVRLQFKVVWSVLTGVQVAALPNERLCVEIKCQAILPAF